MLNIDKLIEAIELQKLAEFDMCVWRIDHSCGTSACIGGTAEILMSQSMVTLHRQEDDAFEWIIEGIAAENIISADHEKFEEMKDSLFYTTNAEGFDKDLEDITAEDAVKTLKHLRDTGEVLWRQD